jgi:phosphoglycerate dehydrogenase-like enzyme
LSATLALLRKTVQADAAVRSGYWPQTSLGGQELSGRYVGIVGMGAIGRLAAPLFTAFGCDVHYWSRNQHADAPVPYANLEELLERSDVVVVAIALTTDTIGLVHASRMAPGALLINAARVPVVNEASLVEAMREGRLSGAALDVFSVEPLPATSPLRELANVLLSPHMAGTTEQAVVRLTQQGATNLRRAATGEPVADVVNNVDPLVRRRYHDASN